MSSTNGWSPGTSPVPLHDWQSLTIILSPPQEKQVSRDYGSILCEGGYVTWFFITACEF